MNNKLPRLTSALLAIAIFLPACSPQLALGETDGPIASASTPTAVPNPSGPYDVPVSTPLPPAMQPAGKTVGDELILQAAAQLERRESISARLRYHLYLSGHQLYGLGSYWQKGTGDELKVRLELQIVGHEANLLQVSNSRFLWVERRLPVGRTVTRLNLQQLRAEAAATGSRLSDIQPGNADWMSTPAELVAHSGGLPSLLSALNERFTFLPPQTMRLATKSKTGQQTASVPFFAVVGHWRKDELTKLLSVDSTVGAENQVPARLPEEVLILVGQADLFPYRLEYRRLETPNVANQAGAAIPYQLSANPMVVLEFTDVAFDVPTDPGQFNYIPGDADWSDRTVSVLERIRLARDQQMAERNATQAAESRR